MNKLFVRFALLAGMFSTLHARADLAAEINLAQTAGFEGARVERFYGPEPLAILGANSAIAFGNIDGDAYDDLIVGAPEYGQDAGIVYIIYGSAGYSAFEYALGNDPDANVRMTLIFGEQGRVGYSVATGDVDGDGFDDVAIGAPAADVPGTLGTGACAIVYGAADMPGTPQGAGSVLTLDIDNAAAQPGVSYYYGIDPSDECGFAVAVGDMTNDGFAEVVVGAPASTVSAKAGAGEIYIFKSPATRRTGGINAAGNPTIDRWFKISGGGVQYRLGAALAVGDVNGDGYGDLAMGAPGVGGGRVYVLSGSDNPIGFLLIDFAAMGFGEIYATGNDDLMGTSIAIGNFDGDKEQDILMGAPRADNVPEDNIGGVLLIHGGTSLIQDAYIGFNQTPGTFGESRILGAAAGTGHGENVAFGDVNGDGLDDIIYSRTMVDSSSGTNVGTLNVHYASGSFPYVVDLATESPDVVVYGGSTDDKFGAAAASFGDLDNDGRSDFAAASNNGLSPYGTQPNASGYAAAIFGDGAPESAFIQHGFPGGNTPLLAVGGGHLSPTFRLWAKFNAGTANYLQVELKRTPADLTNLGPSAKEYWVLSTPKTGWTQADLTFQYTDAQIEGISSSQLKFAQAPAAEGPWTELNPIIDLDKRTLQVSVSELGYFAIYTNLPVISLIGETESFLECGEPYTDPGATAADAEDGDLTSEIETSGAVDTQNPGIYAIAYNVTDSNSNVAQTVVRTLTVRDLIAPQMSLNGAATVFVQCGANYADLGAVSTDQCDGNLNVVVDSSAVNTATPGVYTVNYSSTDDTGNNTQITREVQVVDTAGPVIDLIGEDVVTLDCNEPYIELGATATDACEDDVSAGLSIEITDLGSNLVVASIDSSSAGSFRVDYNAEDSLSNTATEVSRVVNVLANCELTQLICTTSLDAAQQVPSNPSSATGTATWTKVGTGKVVLNITHNVVSPTLAHIHTGAPGANGAPINDFGDPSSPIVAVFTSTEYNSFVTAPHYLNIHSATYSGGEIRGDITCPSFGGEDGVQSADRDGNFVVSLSELLRVIQFYNSLGVHCADDPGDTEDGFVPGPGANQSCQPYDTDYNPQDWVISLSELLRLIQFYNSLGYRYCPEDGTEDDFCPGL